MVNLEVVAYDGDPKQGGALIGKEIVPNIEAPLDLDPAITTIGFSHRLDKGGKSDVYVVIDPDNKMKGEITNFNNEAHAALPREYPVLDATPAPKKVATPAGGGRGRGKMIN